MLATERLKEYLSMVYKEPIELLYVGELGKEKVEELGKELKGFGYGIPYLLEFKVKGEVREVVLETMRPGGFGHEHFSDRAQCLILAHSCYNNLPRHVRSIDVGAFTKSGAIKSIGDAEEYFILLEKVEGREYYKDLEKIKDSGRLTELDLRRCQALSDYLVEIHSVKKDSPSLYVRRVRDLVGHGECIMGLIDSYPRSLSFLDEDELKKIELKCVEWRWRIKDKVHRLCQVHGDYHPWNIIFREGVDFTTLDRSRGEWGEAADDVSCMSINYLFFSLQAYGRLAGPFEELFLRFINNYMDKTKDEDMLKIIQPFYAWRALVVASPIWYPSLSQEVRRKLFNFINNTLENERFEPKEVNSYLKD